MKQSKKILSVILAIVIIIGIAPMGTFTMEAGAETSVDYYYSINNFGEATIRSVDKSISGKIEIPAEHNGYPVTAIGSSAFSGCSELTEVVIPNGVKTIGNYAFSNCPNLSSVKIPNSVETIEEKAFYYWSWSGNNQLKTITIPASVKTLGNNIVEQNTIIYCYKNSAALDYCKNTEGQIYILVDGTTKENTVSGKAGSCKWALNKKTGVLTISGNGKMTDFDNDAPWSSYRKIIKTVKISDGVKNINKHAFSSCYNLTSVNIPDTVTSIGYAAFRDCSSLKNIEIGDGVVSIGEYAFCYCQNLSKVSFGKKVKEIGYYAFGDCEKLTSITLPASITTINGGEFGGCEKLTKINVSKSNKKFSSSDGVIFNKSGTTLVLYPSGKTNTTYSVPKKVTKIAAGAFQNCDKLKKVTIPDSVTVINEHTFANCTNLGEVKLGKNVKTIKARAFWYCSSLKKINLPNGLKTIETAAFQYCAFEKIVLPKSVKTFTDAFSWCFNLKTINIPDDTKEISDCAFWGCSSLQSIKIPNSVTEIGYSAFSSCSSLEKIIIPKAVKSIGDMAFSWSENLKSVTLPKSLKSIGTEAFNCENLKTVYYKGTKTQKSKIAIAFGNEKLISAKWYYNACDGKTSHSYKTVTTKATLKKNGSIVKKCTVCGNIASENKIKYAKTVKLSDTSCIYNGKVKKPSVIVKDSSGKKISSKYYTVTYAKGRKNVGTYKVTVKFKGNYSGTKTLTFKIVPKAASVNKLTAKSKAITVKLNRSLKQSTGYEIQYSTSKSFKNAKIKKVSSYKTSFATIKGLKAKKTYFVRVRTYKTVNGKKYYSNWSSLKYVKTK